MTAPPRHRRGGRHQVRPRADIAVSTVDDVDTESGRITVLALQDLISGSARPVRRRPGRVVGNNPAIVDRRRVSDSLSASVLMWNSVGRQAPVSHLHVLPVVTEVALASVTQAPQTATKHLFVSGGVVSSLG